MGGRILGLLVSNDIAVEFVTDINFLKCLWTIIKTVVVVLANACIIVHSILLTISSARH